MADTEKQRTARSQYAAFADYLDRDLPAGPNRDAAQAALEESLEHAVKAAAE